MYGVVKGTNSELWLRKNCHKLATLVLKQQNQNFQMATASPFLVRFWYPWVNIFKRAKDLRWLTLNKQKNDAEFWNWKNVIKMTKMTVCSVFLKHLLALFMTHSRYFEVFILWVSLRKVYAIHNYVLRALLQDRKEIIFWVFHTFGLVYPVLWLRFQWFPAKNTKSLLLFLHYFCASHTSAFV